MPDPFNCGGGVRAAELFDELQNASTGSGITEPRALTNEDLTSKQVEGSGIFDDIMSSLKVHLGEQFTEGRITGDQYAKAYIELTSAALGTSVQFLLARDANQWQNLLLQKQIISTESEIALNKMRIATEDANFCATVAKTEQTTYQTENILPAQAVLITEQGEAQRAQTLGTRSDGAPVAGSVGKQIDLYDQQIDSYVKDAQYKAGKMYLDAWITQKTLDEGTLPPNELTNATIETVLNNIRTNNSLT